MFIVLAISPYLLFFSAVSVVESYRRKAIVLIQQPSDLQLLYFLRFLHRFFCWLFFFPQQTARCHANVEIMRLICRSDSMLKRKAVYISWQYKFPGSLDSWLEHGTTKRNGDRNKESSDKVWSLLSPLRAVLGSLDTTAAIFA